MNADPPPPAEAVPGTANGASPKRRWKRFGSRFLVLSVAAHLLFGVGAAYLVVQTISAKRKAPFAPGPQAANPSRQALEHKVKMAKKQQTMSAPPTAKRVTTTGFSKVSLPAMPALPTTSSALAPAALAGMTGTFGGTGLGGGGGGSGGGGGGLSLFGLRGSGGGGLEGTFYDFKMQQGYQPVPGMNKGAFAKVVRDFASLTSAWRVDAKYPHYTSPARLKSRYFLYPAIQDSQAGAAFQSPRSGPGSWLAHYKGRFSSTQGGSFRLVGFGDNVMIVKIGEQVVLDASDHGYTGMKREGAGSISFPQKGGTPLFFGHWFEMSAGSPLPIEIVVGDEGGIFCSGLFVQARNAPYAQGKGGIPKLPVFALGKLSEADRGLLGKALPPECLQNTSFQAESVASGSIFDPH